MKHLYIVEDHDTIRESVAKYLELSGFTVSNFALIPEARQAIVKMLPDHLSQDVMMPDADGFEFLKILREQYSFPVIFMTARGAEGDRIQGFEYGADDYVVKPFSPKELVLRVKALFKRIELSESRSNSNSNSNSNAKESLLLELGDSKFRI